MEEKSAAATHRLDRADATEQATVAEESTVTRLRARNELSWSEAALIGIPSGIGLGLLSKAPFVACIALVVAVIIGVQLWRSSRVVGATAIQDEFRDSDYSPIQRWAPLAGAATTVAISATTPFDLLAEAGLSPMLQNTVATIGVVGALVASLKAESTRSFRMGQRRLAQLRRKDTGLSLADEHLIRSSGHQEVFAALVAIGAVDGMQTSSRKVARLLERDVVSELQELKKAGYVELLPQYGANGETTFQVTLRRLPR